MNGYERIVALFEGREVDRLPLMPITMMFAADQIGVTYGQYASDYRTLVEAQLVTAERFGFDYVSCISDPAREAADCGASVQFFPDQPPTADEVHSLLADKTKLAGLRAPDPLGGGRMHDRVRAAALFRERVGGEKLIEGWIEGPCAEAADLRGINRLMTDFFDDPAFVRDLFEFCIDMGVQFAKAQVDAGVDLIGLGDAAASLVGPQLYNEFVLPYERRLIDAIHAMGTRVRLHICGNIGRILDDIGTLGCAMVDVDSMVPLSRCREAMGPTPVLAGNIDPVKVLRNGTPAAITAALRQCRAEAGPRYIVAAGCEVPRDTPEANLRALCAFAGE
ncbi:MAG: uroporphyrinogen decarboxylase family protein [Patescibacteria group bacterium]|nr:uroporphyrinogen decarboxylase family protein [Patescibacteria group bacterium]